MRTLSVVDINIVGIVIDNNSTRPWFAYYWYWKAAATPVPVTGHCMQSM